MQEQWFDQLFAKAAFAVNRGVSPSPTRKRSRWAGFLATLAAATAFKQKAQAADGDCDHGPGEECCGNKAYNTTTHGCCDGVIYEKATQGCCINVVYTLATQGCCADEVVYDKTTQGCCGFYVYTKATQGCCDITPDCTGTTTEPTLYDKATQCCGWCPPGGIGCKPSGKKRICSKPAVAGSDL